MVSSIIYIMYIYSTGNIVAGTIPYFLPDIFYSEIFINFHVETIVLQAYPTLYRALPFSREWHNQTNLSKLIET